jgi:hypothetical protein
VSAFQAGCSAVLCPNLSAAGPSGGPQQEATAQASQHARSRLLREQTGSAGPAPRWSFAVGGRVLAAALLWDRPGSLTYNARHAAVLGTASPHRPARSSIAFSPDQQLPVNMGRALPPSSGPRGFGSGGTGPRRRCPSRPAPPGAPGVERRSSSTGQQAPTGPFHPIPSAARDRTAACSPRGPREHTGQATPGRREDKGTHQTGSVLAGGDPAVALPPNSTQRSELYLTDGRMRVHLMWRCQGSPPHSGNMGGLQQAGTKVTRHALWHSRSTPLAVSALTLPFLPIAWPR